MLKFLFKQFIAFNIIFILFISTALSTPQGSGIINQGFVVENDSETLYVLCLDSASIHVQAIPKNTMLSNQLVIVNDADFNFTDYKVIQSLGGISLETSVLTVYYNAVNKNISFIDKNTSDTILCETTRSFAPINVLGKQNFSMQQSFILSTDEGVYGLGQYQYGLLNYRGQTVNLVHANREIANPVLLSTKNYVLYWDNYSKTVFNDDKDGMSFWSEVGDAVSYYFVYGKDMNDAISGFRRLTGEVPMLPKSAFGFWMSKERYRSFDELVSVVAEYRKRNIPLDNIVQDWQYWGEDYNLWNSMQFDKLNFNNASEVIDELHNKYNVKLTLSVWPGVGEKTKIYQSLDSVGALFAEPTWAGYKVVDIYNPKAQQIYWDYLYHGLYVKGVDSWWMDATEPSFRDGLYQDKQEEHTKSAGETYIGPFHQYLNTYSLILSKVMYDNLRKQSNKRVSILTRSAFAGQQKYSTSTWSGDIYASWDVYKKQIPAGLNFCMTGLPYWTTDIGGFRVISQDKAGNEAKGEIGSYMGQEKKTADGGYRKGLNDSAYLELYTRWFQYGAFTPMFRAHGTEVPREIWHFGEPGTQYYDAQLKMIDLRYSFLSYIYSTAWQVSKNGATMMRALVMDFANDTAVYNNSSSFMFGDALLVNPVTRPMFHNRAGRIENQDTKVDIYLPKHHYKYWYDINSSNIYKCGDSINYNAPLDIIPVFAKAASIVPRNKVVQYANADDNSLMDIYVYTGGDAYFTLYEDDNETYNYEKGLYNEIDFVWDEETNTLSISKIKGELQPRLNKRMFTIHVVYPKSDDCYDMVSKTVDYDNHSTVLTFEHMKY